MYKVSVNNNPFDIPHQIPLSELIALAGFADQTVAAAINGEFVPKHQYPTTLIENNDNIDIVKPIGGG